MTKTLISIAILLGLLPFFGCQQKEEKLTEAQLDEIAEKYGQFAPDDAWEGDTGFAYYGSENEFSRRQFTEVSAERLYKRRGQRQILKIIDGDVDEAIALAEYRLGEDSEDPEYYFILAVAYSQKKDIEKAMDSMRGAIERGMDFGRFLAGPRDLLGTLTGSSVFREYAAEIGQRLLHGPMLGSVSSTSARFWARTSGENQVTIRCYDGADQLIAEQSSRSSAASDYTAVVAVSGLKPDLEYRYETLIDGELVESETPLRVRTYPREGQASAFRMGLGGCAGYTPIYERMWSTVASHDLDAMLMLGDNVYLDLPEMPGAFHDYTYYRRQSNPDFRKLVASTPMYSIWDDHDAVIDDIWMGPFRDKPDWKQPMVNLFNRNWVNPGEGVTEWPGCWYSFSIGDVEVFMLDGRTYRTNPLKEEKTMLGPVQKKWLFDSLKASKATFKIIGSPVAWASDSKPGSMDTWNGFIGEREEIFQFLGDNKIEGVLLLSADRHRTDFWKNERAGDYPLYEIMSARLTNVHTHELMQGALFGYNEKCSFALLNIDTFKADPEIEFKIINIDNEVMNTHVIKRSEISY